MPFVQGDHKVQALASHRPDYPFTDRIRNRRPYRRFYHTQSKIPDTLVNFFGENGIAVMDHDAVRVIGWNRFVELLQRPLSSGIRRDINVKESAASKIKRVRLV